MSNENAYEIGPAKSAESSWNDFDVFLLNFVAIFFVRTITKNVRGRSLKSFELSDQCNFFGVPMHHPTLG